jgi:hypothetical protein
MIASETELAESLSWGIARKDVVRRWHGGVDCVDGVDDPPDSFAGALIPNERQCLQRYVASGRVVCDVGQTPG